MSEERLRQIREVHGDSGDDADFLLEKLEEAEKRGSARTPEERERLDFNPRRGFSANAAWAYQLAIDALAGNPAVGEEKI